MVSKRINGKRALGGAITMLVGAAVVAIPPTDAHAWSQDLGYRIKIDNRTSHSLTFASGSTSPDSFWNGYAEWKDCDNSNKAAPNTNAQPTSGDFDLVSGMLTCWFYTSGGTGSYTPDVDANWNIGGEGLIRAHVHGNFTGKNDVGISIEGDAAKLYQVHSDDEHDSWGPGEPPTAIFTIQQGTQVASVVNGYTVSKKLRNDKATLRAQVLSNIPTRAQSVDAIVAVKPQGGPASTTRVTLKHQKKQTANVKLDKQTSAALAGGRTVATKITVRPLRDGARADGDRAWVEADGNFHQSE